MIRKISTSLIFFLSAFSMSAQVYESELIIGERHINHFNTRDVKSVSEVMSARRMPAVSLKAGENLSSNWIDRIHNLPQYLRDFHTTYGEKVHQVLDGGTNWLYDPTLGIVLNVNNCVATINVFEGTVDFTFPANATIDVIREYAAAAVSPVCNAQWNEANMFMPFLCLSLTYDYPEGYWLSSYYSWQNQWSYRFSYYPTLGTGTITYTNKVYFTLTDVDFDHRRDEFRTSNNISATVTEYNKKVASILDGCPDGYRYQNVSYFNNWLTMHNCYNSDYGHVDNVASIAWSPLSAFRESTGSTGPVCEGYARAFKILCDKMNIPCMLVTGYAKSAREDIGESHMWNEVQMEDGKWYAVDVTWNDPTDGSNRKVSGYENEFWLLLGKKDLVGNNFTFEQSHPNDFTWSSDDSQWEYSFASLLADNKYVFDEIDNPTQAYDIAVENTNGITFYYNYINGDRELEATDKSYGYGSYSGSVVIPQTVTYMNKNRKVTSIGYFAFSGCTDLTTVTIPGSVTSIGEGAFYGCSSLTAVGVENPIPVAICSNVFPNRFNATLYIPAGSKEAYEVADYWKEFGTIKEYKVSDVNGDGNITPSDAIMILYYYFNVEQSDFISVAADVNHDGSISPADAIEVLYKYFSSDSNKAPLHVEPSLEPQ